MGNDTRAAQCASLIAPYEAALQREHAALAREARPRGRPVADNVRTVAVHPGQIDFDLQNNEPSPFHSGHFYFQLR